MSAIIGASLGGVLTAGEGDERMPLEPALHQLVKKHGGEFVGFHRVGTHGGKLLLSIGGAYRMLSAEVDPFLQNRGEVDDVLYDDLRKQVKELVAHG